MPGLLSSRTHKFLPYRTCGVLSFLSRAPGAQHAPQRHQNKQPNNGNYDHHDEYLRVVEILASDHKRCGDIALCSTQCQNALCTESRPAEKPADCGATEKEENARQNATGPEQGDYISDVCH